MGYGLIVNVPVLVNAEPHFNVVVDHYRTFNVEPGPSSAMDLMVVVPEQPRFNTFLDLVRKIDALGVDTVLVVNHGSSDRATDRPLGLILPLTTNAQGWNPDEFTLELLTKFIGYIPDDKECETVERNSKSGSGTRMPAGTLKPLATALQNLRLKNKFKRLELRACNLGGNHDVMQLLGKVLGVRTIVAPKVHMFCLRLGAGVPDTQAAFDTWSHSHSRARVFAGSPSIAIQVNGLHAARTADYRATGPNVKWFLDKYVCPPPSPYVEQQPGRGARVNPFTFCGMDSGGSFVLAQEDGYAAQLVEEAVPRVALTLTVERP